MSSINNVCSKYDCIILPVWFDTETTGLNCANDEIIEIGAQIDDRWMEKHKHRLQQMTQASNTFNSLILPRKEISPEAENVHHITMSMLQESKTSVFQSVARTFLEWLDVWRTRFSIITKDEAHENKVVMLVAHNGN